MNEWIPYVTTKKKYFTIVHWYQYREREIDREKEDSRYIFARTERGKREEGRRRKEKSECARVGKKERERKWIPGWTEQTRKAA